MLVAPDERWFEVDLDGRRRRFDFHDYASVYAVPGLYERLFIDELGMRSTFEVVRLFGEALRRLGADPADQRVLDMGAGNGLGGVELRALGVDHLVAVDLEPQARVAAQRDRPGVYDDYLVLDLGTDAQQLAGRGLTAVVALSAIGFGHVPPDTLRRTLSLLGPGGIYAFAVQPVLMPGSADEAALASGYPQYLEGLLEGTEEISRTEYVHRRQGDGTAHEAVALVGRYPPAGPRTRS